MADPNTEGELPLSFHGVDGNSRKDQGRANLEMMLHSLQPGGIVWDVLPSWKKSPLAPSLTHPCTSCRLYI